MNPKLEKALKRLKKVLPLKEKQQECNQEIKTLHQNILFSFVTIGRMLTKEEMAQHVSDLDEALRVLKEKELVVFSENGTPIGAYPFTMEEREHKVFVNGHQVYAMCALDALAISPMFGMKTHITSQCRASNAVVEVKQSTMEIENLSEVDELHVGILWGAADTDTSCANSLCMEMIFLNNNKTAQQWYAVDVENREVFTLEEAVEFARAFFVPVISS